MGWEDVIAAVGGAAGGANHAVEFYQKQDQQLELARARAESQQELQQLRSILAIALADKNNSSRQTVAGMNNDSRESVAGMNNVSRETVAGMNNTSREGIADANRNAVDERFWGGTMPLGWANNAATIRGQDVSSATTRRGQDIGADTSRSNADLASRTTQRGQNLTDQRGRLGLLQRERTNLFAPETPTDYANPATTDAAPVQRAPVPVAPRGAAAPTGPKMVTLAELNAIAKRRGTTVQEEQRRYEAGGYTVAR